MTGNFPAVSGLPCPLKKEMMTEEVSKAQEGMKMMITMTEEA